MPNSNDIIIISDQGMLDRDVIIQYHQQGVGYLGPLPTLKEYEKRMLVLMSVTTAELHQHPLKYRPRNQKEDESSIYYGVLRKVSVSGQKIAGTVETQALVLYSVNKARLDEDKRNTLSVWETSRNV